MSRKWLVVVVVALLGTIIAVALTMRTASVDTITTEQNSELPYQGLEAEIRTDSVTELLVEFGDVPYSSVAVKQVRLKNTTDRPLALVDYKATCRCTCKFSEHIKQPSEEKKAFLREEGGTQSVTEGARVIYKF